MRLQHGTRPGAVNHAGYAALHIQAHIGVKRCADRRNGLTENLRTVFLQSADQRLVACQRFHGVGHEHAAYVYVYGAIRVTRCVVVADCLSQYFADIRFHLCRVFLGDHAPVEFEHHLARNHIGVGAALNQTDIQIRVRDAFDLGAYVFIQSILRVQSVEQSHRAL